MGIVDGAPEHIRAQSQSVMNSDDEDSEQDVEIDNDESANDPRNVSAPETSSDSGSDKPKHASPARTQGSIFDFDELDERAEIEIDDDEVPAINDPAFREISYQYEIDQQALRAKEAIRDKAASEREAFKHVHAKRTILRIEKRIENQGSPPSRRRIVESVEVASHHTDEPGAGETPVDINIRGDAPRFNDRDLGVLPTESKKKRVATSARLVGKKRLRMSRGITVDSGAADNVMSRKTLMKWMRMRQSRASRDGVHYVAANGARIPNEGEVDFEFETKDGKRHSWLFQIAEVNKVLASVSSLVDAGHRVTFEKDDVTGLDMSYIVNKSSGESIKMHRERNVWTIDTFVNEDLDFIRPE